MSLRAGPWDEAHLSEDPAVELLRDLGYAYVAPEVLEAERDSLRDVVLVTRLGAALKKLNPWLSEDNVHKAVRAVTGVQAASLIEANQALYTTLSYSKSLEQDRGEGKKGQTVHYFDFEKPARNDFLVTRQFKVRGAKKHIIADVVVFVNGIPLVVIECKSPTLGDIWLRDAVEQFARYQEASDSTTTRRSSW